MTFEPLPGVDHGSSALPSVEDGCARYDTDAVVERGAGHDNGRGRRGCSRQCPPPLESLIRIWRTRGLRALLFRCIDYTRRALHRLPCGTPWYSRLTNTKKKLPLSQDYDDCVHDPGDYVGQAHKHSL